MRKCIAMRSMGFNGWMVYDLWMKVGTEESDYCFLVVWVLGLGSWSFGLKVSILPRDCIL